MGSLSKFFAEHLDLFTEAFDLDENSNLVEKDHTSVETVEKLVHEIFVHEMQEILTELVLPRRSSGDEEDDDGHGYRRMRLNPNAFTDAGWGPVAQHRSEEHTSELQSHSFISYAVFCLKKKK